MSYKIKKDGEWVTVANGSRMFVGTTAAIDAAIARGELKYPDLYADISDYAEENATETFTANGCTFYAHLKNGVPIIASVNTRLTSLPGTNWEDMATVSIFANCKSGGFGMLTTNGCAILKVQLQAGGVLRWCTISSGASSNMYVQDSVVLVGAEI